MNVPSTELTLVEGLRRQGKYREALDALARVRITRIERYKADVLRAELLERTGQEDECKRLLEVLLPSTYLNSSERSACEYTSGLIAWNGGDAERAFHHLQRAISYAEAANDLYRVCWAQLRLVVSVANRNGPDSALPLLARTRWNVMRLGDPHVSAALHIYVSEIEEKQGLIDTALHHNRLGLKLLDGAPNLWLEALAENNFVAAALIRCDLHQGLSHAQRARTLAEECGAIGIRRASLVNLGNLYWLAGEFDKAVELFKQGHALYISCGEFYNGALESLARAHLLAGRIDEASACLDLIDRSIRSPSDRLLYANRCAELTKAFLRVEQGRLTEASETVDRALMLAENARDNWLRIFAELARGEIRLLTGAEPPVSVLFSLGGLVRDQPPDVQAYYERLIAIAFAREGSISSASRHLERAIRIYEGIHSVPGRLELTRRWQQITRRSASPQFVTPQGTAGNNNVLQNVAALMLHAGRPELIATGLVAILADTGAVTSAVARAVAEDGTAEVLASCGPAAAAGLTDAITRTFRIGEARSRSVEVVVTAANDIESVATVNAVTLLLATVQDLERARAEREERLTLWPLDELPPDGEQTVVMGRLSELMSLARRVARTNVSVLITGESGTGKEILARAIHRYSARADKPFVPFNCAAIPREMLESQLFGHRRGAFTGADRDNPGVIRAARAGTLLLDEIGELAPELQPKLLRFLESGEISPLGEPNPASVDVRVIAATNANLEQLVQDGRFREDLFYRLNVIRLTIPPLRDRRDEIPALVHHFVGRAAQEFGKGRVRVAAETMEHLILYGWPGNIRQLNNELRRLVALAEPDTVLMPPALSAEILRATPRAAARAAGVEIAVPLTDKLLPTLSQVEREMIKAALKTNHGRVDAAARALGISRKGLYLKRQRLGL